MKSLTAVCQTGASMPAMKPQTGRVSRPPQHRGHGENAEMKMYLSKLKDLVPFMPKNRKLSKLEIIQHVIDYICELQTELESHPDIDQYNGARELLSTPNRHHLVAALAANGVHDDDDDNDNEFDYHDHEDDDDEHTNDVNMLTNAERLAVDTANQQHLEQQQQLQMQQQQQQQNSSPTTRQPLVDRNAPNMILSSAAMQQQQQNQHLQQPQQQQQTPSTITVAITQTEMQQSTSLSTLEKDQDSRRSC